MRRKLPHEKLAAYDKAAMLYVDCCRCTQRVHPRHKPLAEQLARAVSSIALNIAEGATEFSTGDKARFYRMASRSAGEAAAAIDLLHRVRQIEQQTANQLLDVLEELIAVLTTLSKRAAAQR